jgi:hypothetical protein
MLQSYELEIAGFLHEGVHVCVSNKAAVASGGQRLKPRQSSRRHRQLISSVAPAAMSTCDVADKIGVEVVGFDGVIAWLETLQKKRPICTKLDNQSVFQQFGNSADQRIIIKDCHGMDIAPIVRAFLPTLLQKCNVNESPDGNRLIDAVRARLLLIGSQTASAQVQQPLKPRSLHVDIKARRKDVKGGYCECCSLYFTNTLQHLKSPEHAKYRNDQENFVEFDAYIASAAFSRRPGLAAWATK